MSLLVLRKGHKLAPAEERFVELIRAQADGERGKRRAK
jgi:hypothetical protein